MFAVRTTPSTIFWDVSKWMDNAVALFPSDFTLVIENGVAQISPRHNVVANFPQWYLDLWDSNWKPPFANSTIPVEFLDSFAGLFGFELGLSNPFVPINEYSIGEIVTVLQKRGALFRDDWLLGAVQYASYDGYNHTIRLLENNKTLTGVPASQMRPLSQNIRFMTEDTLATYAGKRRHTWPSINAIVVVTESRFLFFQGYSHNHASFWSYGDPLNYSHPLTVASLEYFPPLAIASKIFCQNYVKPGSCDDHQLRMCFPDQNSFWTQLRQCTAPPPRVVNAAKLRTILEQVIISKNSSESSRHSSRPKPPKSNGTDAPLNLECSQAVARKVLRRYRSVFQNKLLKIPGIHVFVMNAAVWLGLLAVGFAELGVMCLILTIVTYTVGNMIRHIDTPSVSFFTVLTLCPIMATPLLVINEFVGFLVEALPETGYGVVGFLYEHHIWIILAHAVITTNILIASRKLKRQQEQQLQNVIELMENIRRADLEIRRNLIVGPQLEREVLAVLGVIREIDELVMGRVADVALDHNNNQQEQVAAVREEEVVDNRLPEPHTDNDGSASAEGAFVEQQNDEIEMEIDEQLQHAVGDVTSDRALQSVSERESPDQLVVAPTGESIHEADSAEQQAAIPVANSEQVASDFSFETVGSEDEKALERAFQEEGIDYYAAVAAPDSQPEQPTNGGEDKNNDDDDGEGAKVPINQENQEPNTIARENSEDSEDICRICLDGRGSGNLVAPCKCKGSMRYVHVGCLNAWRTSSNNPASFSQCDNCKYFYRIQRSKVALVFRSALFHLILAVTTVCAGVIICAIAIGALENVLPWTKLSPDLSWGGGELIVEIAYALKISPGDLAVSIGVIGFCGVITFGFTVPFVFTKKADELWLATLIGLCRWVSIAYYMWKRITRRMFANSEQMILNSL
eukprot:c20152_g1_i3.p1 GENE.c20152_g1_i3~~c20152_g1_i3.p1  ORF type:complete len:974 (+),score=223.64 c20152_g1_i3:181-2922(+)